jgi:hypothetical protein
MAPVLSTGEVTETATSHFEDEKTDQRRFVAQSPLAEDVDLGDCDR